MTNKNFLFVAAFFFTSILFAQKRLYIHSSGKELALVDADGNLKTKTDFDEIEDFGADDWTNTKAFLMKKGDNFGLINYQGEWIFPLKYSGISCRNGLCNLSEKGKSGFGNEKEEILVPLEYEELGFINEDKIKAQKEGKWGYINVKNEWIIAPQFDSEKLDVYDFSEDLAKICLKDQENGCGYINLKGDLVIPQIYDIYSGDFHDGLAKTQLKDKIAYINKSGKIAFPSEYSYSSESDFKNGVALVSKNCKRYDDYGVCETYLIDTKGQNLLPKDCVIERSFPEENYHVIRNLKIQLKGVINNKGNIIVPLDYSDVGNYEGPFDWISVSKYNKDDYEMSGFYDRAGKKMTEPIYSICGTYTDELNPKSETYICIENQNSEGRGVLNKNGKAILPPIYENVELSDGIFVVSKLDGKATIGGAYNLSCGYLNEDGSILIPLKFVGCSPFSQGFATVTDNLGTKIINKKGEIVKDLANNFESVSQFSHGYANVGKNEKQGIINIRGEITVPLIYDYIYHYNDVIQVKNGDQYGIINASGKIIVPIIYEDTTLSSCNGKVYGKNGDRLTWYNLDGQKLNDRIPIAQCAQ